MDWGIKMEYIDLVAPFAGAWIEMSSTLVFSVAPVLSLPSRERGLKFTVDAMNTAEHLSLPSRERGLKYSLMAYKMYRSVAPFAGAWIEIFFMSVPFYVSRVAPFAGAWIEIQF